MLARGRLTAVFAGCVPEIFELGALQACLTGYDGSGRIRAITPPQLMARAPRTPPPPPPKLPKRAAFDEQLWPVNVVLVVMAGFVGGIVLATCRLNDPRLYYNGW